MPVLNDSGATCSCTTEEQVLVIVNHTQQMLADGLMTMDDYKYPIIHASMFVAPPFEL